MHMCCCAVHACIGVASWDGSGSGRFASMCLSCLCRVRPGAAHAGQRAAGGAVHRRHQAVVSHPWQDAQEGLGQHGEFFAPCMVASWHLCTSCVAPPHQMRCWSEEPHPSCYLQGDIILVGLRDYQDEKADVILKCAPMPCNRACCSSLMLLVEQLMSVMPAAYQCRSSRRDAQPHAACRSNIC
jgi:hypothetical protein